MLVIAIKLRPGLFLYLLGVVDRRVLLQQRINRRHQEQRPQRSEQQAADHGATQRSILLAALAKRRRHRQHADDHRQRRHQHRSQPGMPGIQRRLAAVLARQPLIVRKHYHQNRVRRRHANRHNRAHQARHAERRLRQEQHPQDPAERAGNRHQNNQRIKPRLKVHRHQHVHQQDREDDADAQPHERVVHRLHLAAQLQLRRLRQRLLRLVHDLLDLARHAAQIALVHIGIDIVGRLNVVVVDDDRRKIAPEARHIAQQLRCIAIRRRHRRARQRLQAVDAIDRRLRHDLVVHAIGRIQPFIRRRLPRARQRDQRRLRHILLRQTDLPRLRAVHVHLHRRVVHLLVHMHIDRARIAAICFASFFASS